MRNECYCDLSQVVDRLNDAAWTVVCPRCGSRFDAILWRAPRGYVVTEFWSQEVRAALEEKPT